MNLRTYYETLDPSAERLNGIWEESDGSTFLDRERWAAGSWSAPRIEAQGLYHFVIQTRPQILNGVFNGVQLNRGLLPAGTVRLTRPHDEVRATGIGAIRRLQIAITADYLTASRGELRFNRSDLEFRSFAPRADTVLARLVRIHENCLSHAYVGNELYFELLRQSILNRVLSLYVTRRREIKTPHEVLTVAKVRRVTDYIEANLATDLRLVDLAVAAGVSKFHFARAFCNTVGTTPHAFVVQRRLAYAVALLRNANLPLKYIAEQCGFCDAAHLARSFKLHFGCQPSKRRS